MSDEPIRSALYIDADNVPLPAERMRFCLDWLAAGAFDANRRRDLVVKRIYWCSPAERYRDQFERQGFEVVLCGKYAKLKNGADIRMAMDIVEATLTAPDIEEFILMTRDSDFVPVLQRLRAKGRRSVILADETRPEIHTTYHTHADALIPLRLLAEAVEQLQPPLKAIAIAAEPELRSAEAAANLPPTAFRLEHACELVLHTIGGKRNSDTKRKTIEKALKGVPGFTKEGENAYLGLGTYPALMLEIASREPRIAVRGDTSGGVSVRAAGAATKPPDEGAGEPREMEPEIAPEVADLSTDEIPF